MLNRRATSRITNCDILTRKGPITLKVYREDDTSEIIPEFKASNLHLGEWREVVKACPNKKGKGWISIYKQIQERMDYLRTTKAELGIDLDRPLSEQDPLDRLNDLANKKRKHADDIHDFFRANKKLKSSVQYKDHPAGTVLNEPVLEEHKPSNHLPTFQKRAEKENLNNQQPKPTTPPATTIIPPIITTTTTQMQSPPQNPQKGSSQLEGEHIKKDKGKKAMSSKDAKEVSTESSFDDETTHMPSSMVESSKKKDLKKFDFVTKDGEHVHLTKEQISVQKKIEEEAKAEAAKREGEMRKEELIDLLGPEVVNKYYNDKLQKGPITLKVYKEDDTSEIIPEFKASDLHLDE
ncbi:hypothetical protein Tco_1007413 [Tanacetum coccineum]